MVLRTARPGPGRYCTPGKGAWNVLVGAPALATFAGDIDLTPLLKSESDHAGA